MAGHYRPRITVAAHTGCNTDSKHRHDKILPLGSTHPVCRTVAEVAPHILRNQATSSSFVAATPGTSGTAALSPYTGES